MIWNKPKIVFFLIHENVYLSYIFTYLSIISWQILAVIHLVWNLSLLTLSWKSVSLYYIEKGVMTLPKELYSYGSDFIQRVRLEITHLRPDRINDDLLILVKCWLCRTALTRIETKINIGLELLLHQCCSAVIFYSQSGARHF